MSQRPQRTGIGDARAPASRGAASPNTLIYPSRRAQLPAAHQVHAERTRLSCLDCHGGARTSTAAADWLGPSPAGCADCHPGRFERVAVAAPPVPKLRFSHARHTAKGIDCVKCHGRVAERADALGTERLPLMATCLDCHAEPRATQLHAGSDCRLCHLGQGGVIRTRFRDGLLLPSNSLGPIEHRSDWRYRHSDAAMNQGPLCTTCHRESECVACHNSPLRPRSIHPSDWLHLHGIEARQAGASCTSCHRSQSECLTCHLRAGVSSAGPRAAIANRGRFHPPPSIWTDGPRTARHHAVQARLHMDECVSCHQERDCAACHATAAMGGPGTGTPFGRGISPHPPGFRTVCGGLLGRNPRPCYVCHKPDDWELLPCR